jgi:hypothetical protein
VLELIDKLKKLRELIDPRYSGMLYAVVKSAIAGDYRKAHDGVWDLGKVVSGDATFGKEASVLAEVSAEDMDAAFEELSKQTVTAGLAGWLLIAQMVIELLQKLKK